MPKDKITMATIASSSVKPDCGLRCRLFGDMIVPLFLPLAAVPVVFTHTAGGPKDGDGAGRRGLPRNTHEDRAVYQRVTAIDERTGRREFHDRWTARDAPKIDAGSISKIEGRRKIRNGAENYVLSPAFERHSARRRCRTDEPEFRDRELVRSPKLHLD